MEEKKEITLVEVSAEIKKVEDAIEAVRQKYLAEVKELTEKKNNLTDQARKLLGRKSKSLA